MTYIIAEPCIDIKDLSCVDVCRAREPALPRADGWRVQAGAREALPAQAARQARARARVRGARSLRGLEIDDAQRFPFPAHDLGDPYAFVAPRRWRPNRLADRRRLRPRNAAPAEARERELSTWCPARSRLRGRRLEQAGDSFERAPALRSALRQQGGSVQGLLRPDQLLALPGRPSRLRRHWCGPGRRQSQA